MMDAPLLTIVIPVRNAALWLPQCLTSIAALEPAPDEIIVVDDASDDETPELLSAYSAQYPWLRLIRLDHNGGAAFARNRGLEVARGKYLAFVDADDHFQPDRFRNALVVAEQDQLDLVFLNATFHHEGRKADRPVFRQAHPDRIMTGGEWLKSVLPVEPLHHAVWLHLYRTDWLRGTGIRFPEGITSEDVIWTTEVLLQTRRMRYLPEAGYFYRIAPRNFDAATAQTRLEFLLRSSVINALRMGELAATVADAELRRLLAAQMLDGALSVFHILKKMPDRDKARGELIRLRTSRFLSFLWRHAKQWPQKRRILRNWLSSWGVPWRYR